MPFPHYGLVGRRLDAVQHDNAGGRQLRDARSIEDGWHAGCERSIQLLRFGGDGHSVVIHSRDEESIMSFGIEKPAFRILVNTWGSLGGVGFTTGIRPSMTLGPGGMGGAAVSDNITVEHVLNVKRIAYHLHDVDPAARTAKTSGPTDTPAVKSPESDLIERVVRRVVEEMRR